MALRWHNLPCALKAAIGYRKRTLGDPGQSDPPRGPQQGDRVRRIGVLMGSFDENDPLAKAFVSAFIQALADLGWTDGRNVRMDLVGAATTSIGYERSRRS